MRLFRVPQPYKMLGFFPAKSPECMAFLKSISPSFLWNEHTLEYIKYKCLSNYSYGVGMYLADRRIHSFYIRLKKRNGCYSWDSFVNALTEFPRIGERIHKEFPHHTKLLVIVDTDKQRGMVQVRTEKGNILWISLDELIDSGWYMLVNYENLR